MARRAVRWLAAALVLAAVAGFAAINLVAHDPDRWHVDPAEIELRGTPNEFLAAPEGATAAEPHMETAIHEARPEELLARFDDIARAAPRTKLVAGDPDSGMATYVQRSRYVGFPDYITVKAVKVGEGAGLVVYSRSRYGRGDFGVNRARVERWLGRLDGA